MLTYFPTPLPGEWWYSVLCRYHVRSGHAKHQTTVRELFQGKTLSQMGAVFPNSIIPRVLAQLPSGFLKPRDIVIRHTLFPYYTRCYPPDEKEQILKRLALGKTEVITSIRLFADASKRSPRFCPLCWAEDRQKYGEAYWHIAHQIPLLTICPVHGCSLVEAETVLPSHLSYTFFPLDTYAPPEPQEPPGPLWQSTFSQILYEYQMLPIERGATDGYNNLAICLGNLNYEIIQNHSPHTILDARRLYQDLVDFYGPTPVEQIFGTPASTPLLNRVCKWEMKVPERYALLQCFAGLDSTSMFSEKRLRSRYESALLDMESTGVRYGKKDVAHRLGVTTSQLDLLSKKYDIVPFWTQNKADVSCVARKLNIPLNETELLLFKNALRKSGFRYDSHFAKYCILQYIKQNADRKEELQ